MGTGNFFLRILLNPQLQRCDRVKKAFEYTHDLVRIMDKGSGVTGTSGGQAPPWHGGGLGPRFGLVSVFLDCGRTPHLGLADGRCSMERKGFWVTVAGGVLITFSFLSLSAAESSGKTGARPTTTTPSKRVSAKERAKLLKKVLKKIPAKDRARIVKALQARPERSPKKARPAPVLAKKPAPVLTIQRPKSLRESPDIQSFVLDNILALLKPKQEERDAAERRIVALGSLGHPVVREIFAVTADPELREQLATILFRMGDYTESLPFVLEHTGQSVWNRIVPKLVRLEEQERQRLRDALWSLPAALHQSRHFNFLLFTLGERGAIPADLDKFESWFAIPCCPPENRDTLFMARFAGEKESYAEIKKRLLQKKSLQDEIRIFYLEFLSVEQPKLLDPAFFIAMMQTESSLVRDWARDTLASSFHQYIPQVAKRLLKAKDYDSLAGILAQVDLSRSEEKHRTQIAELLRELLGDSRLWAATERGDRKQLERFAAIVTGSAVSGGENPKIIARYFAKLADMMRQPRINSTVKRTILRKTAPRAFDAARRGKEAPAAAARFLHEAFRAMESPPDLPHEDTEGWLALVAPLTPFIEGPDGDRFLTWYCRPSSQSRSPTSRYVRTRTSSARTRTTSSRYRSSDTDREEFAAHLLATVRSRAGRSNIARMLKEERILPASATVELVNDERIPAELRCDLVETEPHNYYPKLFKSFACLQRLYPKLNEETILGLINFLWPGEPRATRTEYSLSEDELRQFMQLVARDPRDAVTRRVNTVKNLPRDICLALAKQWLSHPEASVREKTVRKLGSYATREVVPLILPLLSDKDDAVRAAVASVLGSLVAVETEAALRELRDDPSSEVRKAVATALRAIEDIKNLNGPPAEAPPKG